MIRLFLGRMGSGKTACLVRELALNEDSRHTFSNIITKKIKNNHVLERANIVHKEVVAVQKNGKEVSKLTLNDKFWKELHTKYGSINVCLDEFHTLMDSRRSSSALNKVLSDFTFLLRRILGSNNSGYGTLTIITQLLNSIDVRMRNLSTEIHYHICHYHIYCKKCGRTIEHNNELPDYSVCEACGGNKLEVSNHIIEKYLFQSIGAYTSWYEFGQKGYYDHYYVTNIIEYFPLFDTFQWLNMITD